VHTSFPARYLVTLNLKIPNRNNTNSFVLFVLKRSVHANTIKTVLNFSLTAKDRR